MNFKDKVKAIFFSVVQTQDIGTVVKTAYELSGKPIIIHDINYTALAVLPQNPIDDHLFDAVLREGQIPFSFYEELMRDFFDKYGPMTTTPKPVYLDCGMFEKTPRIYGNITAGGKFWGGATIICKGGLDQEKDFIIMEALCQALSLLPKQMGTLPPKHIRTVLSINELVAGHRSADISDWLQDNKINPRLCFCVLNARKENKEQDDNIISPFIGNYIESNIPNSLVLGVEKEINFLFFNIQKSPLGTAKNITTIEKACSLLIRHGFLCGLSRLSNDIWDTRFLKDQASQALSVGSVMEPNKKIFLFTDYVNHCIGRKLCNVSDYKIFAHPALKILEDHDKNHDSVYLKTLIEYIKEFKDSSKAAKNLHIHKNSLHYRLGKIQELCELDFDNPQDCFQILLSSYMHEAKESTRQA
jgi:hypothetical protein